MTAVQTRLFGPQARDGWVVVRNVPKSQVWPGSRGAHTGRLHLRAPLGDVDRVLTKVRAKGTGRGRAQFRSIERGPGQLLCGARPWHVAEDAVLEGVERCPRCEDLALRYGVRWPEAAAS